MLMGLLVIMKEDEVMMMNVFLMKLKKGEGMRLEMEGW